MRLWQLHIVLAAAALLLCGALVLVGHPSRSIPECRLEAHNPDAFDRALCREVDGRG